MTSQDYEQQAEEFLSQLEREHYLNLSGQKETLHTAALYERYGALFSPEAARELMVDREGSRESRFLAEFAAFGHLDRVVGEIDDELANQATAATVTWDGEEVPYRYTTTLMANETDTERRHALEQRVNARTAELNPQRELRWGALHREAVALDFASYVEMCDQLKALSLAELSQAAQDFLESTETAYHGLLEERLAQAGVPRQGATHADIGFLSRAPQFDALFPKEEAPHALAYTLERLGIRLEDQPNLVLDNEPRPLKSPRAFCAPVRVPEEVYLVTMPKGGQDDFRALLHEGGHAEHFAHVDPSLPFAYRMLGDNSVTESYAFLFDNLMHDAGWLAEVLGIAEADDYLRLGRFHKLYLVRRYCLKLLYERQLHLAGDLPPLAETYARDLGHGLGVTYSRENYLSDVDDAFYCAQYLRAWFFEAHLRRFLQGRYGERWFCERQAGDLLKELWREGQKFGVEEIGAQVGVPALDPAALAHDFAR